MPWKNKISNQKCANPKCDKFIAKGARKWCSIACYNKITKIRDIDGYKKCLYCAKEFPFRKSAKVRSSWSIIYGRVGSIKQKYCSRKCSLLWRNKYDNPLNKIWIREKISLLAKKRSVSHLHTPEALAKRRLAIMGMNHWNWQGGVNKNTKKNKK